MPKILHGPGTALPAKDNCQATTESLMFQLPPCPHGFVDHLTRFTHFKWSCNSAIYPGSPGRISAKGLIKNLWVKNLHLRTLHPLSSVWGLFPCKYGQEYQDFCFMGGTSESWATLAAGWLPENRELYSRAGLGILPRHSSCSGPVLRVMAKSPL